MIDMLYRVAESSVSPANILLTTAVSILISAIVGFAVGSNTETRRAGLISATVTQVFWIAVLLTVRTHVHEYRMDCVSDTMRNLRVSGQSVQKEAVAISDWRQGLTLIRRHPTAVGYYADTADIFIELGDYEAAATLIEYGVDLIGVTPPPDILCYRLRQCYARLPDRPELDEDCTKYHRL
jgi:hypothetical protein